MKRKTKLQLPKSTRDILSVFNLSRTNQILRGRSPTFQIQDETQKQWTELLASEIFSAKVDVVPQPAEYNVHLVSSDPRLGRYKKTQQSSHLCKTIRKNVINNILKKYHLAEPKVDSGKRRKKPNKKDLEEWKLRRAQGLEGWKKKKRVISTKKKKFQKYQPCSTCGDYHFKRICSGKDLKVNLIVRQINQKAEVIKENMDEAWSKLHALEQTYNHMLMKTYRLQSNHICLQMLAGQEDGHPDRCPCAAIKKAEEAKIEAQRKDEEIRKKLEKKTERDKERARREELIEKRRQHYYQSLKRAETKESQPKIHDPTALTKLDSKRSSMKTLDQISEISRDLGQPLDLILMDGNIKTVKEEYYEEGGMVMQSLHIDSVPEYIKKQMLEKVSEKAEVKGSIDEEEKDETIMDDLQSLDSDDKASIKSEASSKKAMRTGDSVPFEKFLDFMEIF